jgi:hypothetical protein
MAVWSSMMTRRFISMGGKVGKYLRRFNNGNYKVQLCPNGLIGASRKKRPGFRAVVKRHQSTAPVPPP